MRFLAIMFGLLVFGFYAFAFRLFQVVGASERELEDNPPFQKSSKRKDI